MIEFKERWGNYKAKIAANACRRGTAAMQLVTVYYYAISLLQFKILFSVSKPSYALEKKVYLGVLVPMDRKTVAVAQKGGYSDRKRVFGYLFIKFYIVHQVTSF
jgi:hypothetical protein